MPLSAIELSSMEKYGRGLDRPEDVVVSRAGRVFASDQQSAVAEIFPDGSIQRIGKAGGAPNGINMDKEGRIIIANFGIFNGSPGPLQRLDIDSGTVENLVAEVAGKQLTSSNYPIVAKDGTIWCTHSTFAEQWPLALDGRKDGFVFNWQEGSGAARAAGGSGVLADGLMFSNGCCLDEAEEYLYVNQTSAGNVVRFKIKDGALGAQEAYGPVLGVIPKSADPSALPTMEERASWAYTDGNGFDVEGNLWVTLPAANKIVALRPSGDVFTIAQDMSGEILNHPTNVTWGGADMKDLFIGSLYSDYVIKTRSPVAGLKLAHQR